MTLGLAQLLKCETVEWSTKLPFSFLWKWFKNCNSFLKNFATCNFSSALWSRIRQFTGLIFISTISAYSLTNCMCIWARPYKTLIWLQLVDLLEECVFGNAFCTILYLFQDFFHISIKKDYIYKCDVSFHYHNFYFIIFC